ncbi:MAG: nitrous oxide reductase family maturation protein NosD [Candidatus Heimdallarchaeota archaeon]
MKRWQSIIIPIFSVLVMAHILWDGQHFLLPIEREVLVRTNFKSPTAPNVPDQIYTQHDRINIVGDKDLKNSFPGGGTLSDPIRIEGFNITAAAEDLISISGTSSYFRIANNLLNGDNGLGNGISLYNVTNGEIYNNVIFGNNQNGIKLYVSNNNSVHNNILYKNGFAEINLARSNNNNISENTVSKNTFAAGIYLVKDNSNNVISNNTLFNNGVGIRFESEANRNEVIQNDLYENRVGIHLEFVRDISVKQNRIRDNLAGIKVTSGDGFRFSRNITVSRNLIYHNQGYGMILERFSKDIRISSNDFIKNNQNKNSQAFDGGENNTFAYNYWDEWTDPDYNKDGFVDFPYNIDGSTNNQDGFSWASPPSYNTEIPLEHTMAALILLILILGALGFSILQQQYRSYG